MGNRLICQVFDHSPVFRMGGDEFAVALQGDDYENRDALTREFEHRSEQVNAVAAQPWEHVNASMGMAVYEPGRDQGASNVLARADERMYEDKRQYKADWAGLPGRQSCLSMARTKKVLFGKSCNDTMAVV